ncbi:protein of unknown function [Bacillus velezensis]|nr:protein of unknown function [Bacillus velezensis]
MFVLQERWLLAAFSGEEIESKRNVCSFCDEAGGKEYIHEHHIETFLGKTASD